jgi:fumarate reductase flavoprotein subunit
VLLATGGGPTMYKYHTPSGDKSCDGLAMALRAGLPLRDMEMVQFHPTGMLAGPDTRMTGTVLEEGLRGAGGWLLDKDGARFMSEYDPRGERATRDVVSRAIFDAIRKGRGTSLGGVYIQMSHLGPDQVRKSFKGMVERCADCGFDLAGGRVEVVPTAHYMMGGVPFRADCATELDGLFAAGEDTGGVHGANRLGGNGVANSTVFGGLAGDAMAAWVAGNSLRAPDEASIAAGVARATAPFGRTAADLEPIRETLYYAMWEEVGIVRDAASLQRGRETLARLTADLARAGVADATREFAMTWQDWLNLDNLTLVSRAITEAAEARTDSRGAHFRADHPKIGDLTTSRYTVVRLAGDSFRTTTEPVAFARVKPGQTLLKDAAD